MIIKCKNKLSHQQHRKKKYTVNISPNPDFYDLSILLYLHKEERDKRHSRNIFLILIIKKEL